jgi:transcription elongation GreA/GreB family factor
MLRGRGGRRYRWEIVRELLPSDPPQARYLVEVSKAFTKEDDDAGFLPPRLSSKGIPDGPFRLTAEGAQALAAHADPRVRAALGRAEVPPPQGSRPERAALGVTVRVRTADDKERSIRLVSAEERALLGDGCSIQSPLGRALLGARVGDVRELRAPRGAEELEIVALEGEA